MFFEGTNPFTPPPLDPLEVVLIIADCVTALLPFYTQTDQKASNENVVRKYHQSTWTSEQSPTLQHRRLLHLQWIQGWAGQGPSGSRVGRGRGPADPGLGKAGAQQIQGWAGHGVVWIQGQVGPSGSRVRAGPSGSRVGRGRGPVDLGSGGAQWVQGQGRAQRIQVGWGRGPVDPGSGGAQWVQGRGRAQQIQVGWGRGPVDPGLGRARAQGWAGQGPSGSRVGRGRGPADPGLGKAGAQQIQGWAGHGVVWIQGQVGPSGSRVRAGPSGSRVGRGRDPADPGLGVAWGGVNP